MASRSVSLWQSHSTTDGGKNSKLEPHTPHAQFLCDESTSKNACMRSWAVDSVYWFLQMVKVCPLIIFGPLELTPFDESWIGNSPTYVYVPSTFFCKNSASIDTLHCVRMMSFRALVGWRYFVFVVLLQKIIFFLKILIFWKLLKMNGHQVHGVPYIRNR